MNNNLILGIFFSVTGILLFWGTKKRYNEINKLYKDSDLPDYYRMGSKSSTDNLRIASIAFILVGLSFLYNEIAEIMKWYTTRDLFSMLADRLY